MAGVLEVLAVVYFAGVVPVLLVANVGGCRDWLETDGAWTTRAERRRARS